MVDFWEKQRKEGENEEHPEGRTIEFTQAHPHIQKYY